MFRDSQGRFVLAGDGSFRFGVVVDGDDLLVENVHAIVIPTFTNLGKSPYEKPTVREGSFPNGNVRRRIVGDIMGD